MGYNYDLQKVIKAVDWIVFDGIVKNRRELAEKLGYTESSFSQILNGKVGLSERFIKKLLNFEDRLNPDWFLIGDSKMLKEISDTTNAHGNYLSKYTDKELDQILQNQYRAHLLRMYEQGEAYPEIVVKKMMAEKDIQIKELQHEVWELQKKLQLNTDSDTVPIKDEQTE